MLLVNEISIDIGHMC